MAFLANILGTERETPTIDWCATYTQSSSSSCSVYNTWRILHGMYKLCYLNGDTYFIVQYVCIWRWGTILKQLVVITVQHFSLIFSAENTRAYKYVYSRCLSYKNRNIILWKYRKNNIIRYIIKSRIESINFHIGIVTACKVIQVIYSIIRWTTFIDLLLLTKIRKNKFVHKPRDMGKYFSWIT